MQHRMKCKKENKLDYINDIRIPQGKEQETHQEMR